MTKPSKWTQAQNSALADHNRRDAERADLAASCAYWTGCALQHDADANNPDATPAERGIAQAKAAQARDFATAQAQRWWGAGNQPS